MECAVPEFCGEFAVVIVKFKPHVQWDQPIATGGEAFGAENVPIEMAGMLDSSLQVWTKDLVDRRWVWDPIGVLFDFEVVRRAPDRECFVAKLF